MFDSMKLNYMPVGVRVNRRMTDVEVSFPSKESSYWESGLFIMVVSVCFGAFIYYLIGDDETAKVSIYVVVGFMGLIFLMGVWSLLYSFWHMGTRYVLQFADGELSIRTAHRFGRDEYHGVYRAETTRVGYKEALIRNAGVKSENMDKVFDEPPSENWNLVLACDLNEFELSKLSGECSKWLDSLLKDWLYAYGKRPKGDARLS